MKPGLLLGVALTIAVVVWRLRTADPPRLAVEWPLLRGAERERFLRDGVRQLLAEHGDALDALAGERDRPFTLPRDPAMDAVWEQGGYDRRAWTAR